MTTKFNLCLRVDLTLLSLYCSSVRPFPARSRPFCRTWISNHRRRSLTSTNEVGVSGVILSPFVANHFFSRCVRCYSTPLPPHRRDRASHSPSRRQRSRVH